MKGGLNGGVRFDLVLRFFQFSCTPDLWKFDKNKKFAPSSAKPGPEVWMTFNRVIFGLGNEYKPWSEVLGSIF